MLRQISQVALTYVMHRNVMIGVLLWAGLMLAPQLMSLSSSKPGSADAAQPIAMTVGMPLLFLMPFLVGHVKMQFAHPRCRLLPRFLPAHLVTLCGFLGLIAIAYPLLLAQLGGFEALGLVALSLAIAVPAIWGAHFGRILWYAVALGVFYSLLTEVGLRWWVVDSPQHWVAHALVVAAGGLLLVGWLWRLAHLEEEMNDYLVVFNWRVGQRSAGEHSDQRRLIAEMLRRSKLSAVISDAWLDRIGGYHGGNPLRLARLMRFVFATIPPGLHAVMMAAMLLAISLFMIEFSYVSRDAGPGSLWFLIQMAILMPGMFAGEWLFQRKPRMACELLRPVSRTQYFNAVLVASAWNAATVWLIMHAAVALAMLRVSFDQLALATVATFVSLSIASGFAAFGLGQRTAVWDSYIKRIGVMMLSWIALTVPIVVWWVMREDFGDLPFVLTAGGVFALGAALLFDARRAWHNLELG